MTTTAFALTTTRPAASTTIIAVQLMTGPPGTGKSELVLNLVANALALGETVMVASRNNKAVSGWGTSPP